ncbi:hypothetical protein M514_07839 [Trichuris suis]|uniref:Uncharacterized protein n=1 Tax=Trichuris suis TaxID=68888 RepID=A0A085N5C9_9BILA|nr:hypothetical protein M513_07839 [Trichuris suis]KFD64675.1 hypothetical protein M514_07839 [Trichuris suis]
MPGNWLVLRCTCGKLVVWYAAAIVKRHIRLGTAVIKGEWRGNRFLAREGYARMGVNHSRSFVNRESGAHKQSIESRWSQAKSGNKLRCGMRHSSDLAATTPLRIRVEEEVGIG